MKHSRVSIFRIGEKIKSNVALVVVLVSNLKVSIVKCHVTSNKRQWLCFASLMKELLFPYSHEKAREYFLECKQESYANYVIIFGFFVSFYRH